MPGFEIINHKEKKAVNKIFENGGVLFAHGFEKSRKNFHVREFEKTFGKKLKSKYNLAVSSGTAAIKIALKALGVKSGDEVITQAFNFIATIEAILDVGAIPRIVNIDKSLNMNPEEIKSVINKKTKVILPVHMLGVSAEIKEIIKISKKYKIKVLEDNCEAIGGKYSGKYLGTLADIGVFSFDFGKTITTGEGGMIVTKNKKLDKYSREYHDHGHENNPKFPRGKDTKTIYGFNYRMTEMQAAVGKVQLSKLKYILNCNKSRFLSLKKNIAGIFEIRKEPNKSISSYDTFIFFEEDNKIRSKIINLLKKEGYGTKNLPDAIEWHCSAFWDHALSSKEIKKSIKTKEILKNAIAVPIWLKRTPKEYENLGKKIKKFK